MESGYEVLSRGLQGTGNSKRPTFENLRYYNLEWSLSSPVLEKLGIELPASQTVTPIDRTVVERAALILVMDLNVLCGNPKNGADSLVRQFPEHGFKMRLYRELVGSVEGFHDCFGERNPERHREVIEEIHRIAFERLETITKLADLFSAYRKETKT